MKSINESSPAPKRIRIARFLLAFLKEEEGQATIEYILILAVVAAVLLMTVKKLINPAFAKLNKYMTDTIEKNFFGSNLHYYPVKR